jgi:hypothetical protein
VNFPRSHAQPIGGDAGLAMTPGAAFDLYLPEGSGIIIFAVPASPAAVANDADEGQTAQRRVLDKTQTALGVASPAWKDACGGCILAVDQ